MKVKKKAVIALSGGMDSTCLLINLLAMGVEVVAVSFDYGQRHKVELQKAKDNLDYLKANGFHIPHEVVNISNVGGLLNSALTFSKDVPEGHYEDEEMKDTVVPNRNKIFSSILQAVALSIATQHDEDVWIALGIHAGDHAVYPDCRQEFRDADYEAFLQGNWEAEKVSYYTPYLEFGKAGILTQCLDDCEKLGLSFDTILGNTSTTYAPTTDGLSEGKTSSDIERIEAFIEIEREDPASYTKPWKEIVAHAKRILKID